MLHIGVVGILLLICYDAASSNCPVSSRLAVEKGYLSYPWEVFGPSTTVPEHSFECSSTAHMEHLENAFHCTFATPCPHSSQTVIDATSAVSWKVRPSICASFQQAGDVINVVYFGGSVPHGHHARGCCCTEGNHCPIVNDICNAGDTGGVRAQSCSWVGYLNYWMVLEYPNQRFVVHDFTAPGTTSVEKSMKFNENHALHGIGLKSKDIIIIDYSVNDGTIYKNRLKDLQYGVESFIRRLLTLGDFPTIILLESLPSVNYNFMKFHPPTDADYSQVYRAVAKHYALPVWSYRDHVWSSTAAALPYASYIQWSNNGRSSKEHPPWFVHLYMADAFAAIWEQTVSACDTKNTRSTALFLPTPLTENIEKQSFACEEDSYYSLALSASEQYILNIDTQYFSTHGEIRGFKLVSERGGKVGYVADSGSVDAALVLPFNLTELVIKGSTLKIEYLKTHFNAGAALVSVCGHELGEIDALWRDETMKYSNNEILVFRICRLAQYCTSDVEHAVVITHKQLPNRLPQRNLQKFKVVSVSMCSHAKICMFAAGFDDVFTY